MTEREPEEEARPRFTDRRRVRPHDDGRSGDGPGAASGAGAAASAAAAQGAAAPELQAARSELAECREHLQRLSADFDNARKRMVKDQTHAIERASERLVARLLEVLDEFQLAMTHGEQERGFAPYLKGFELVYAKFFDTLTAEGLERIEAVGKPFDPTLHEALLQTGDGDGEPVVDEVWRDGYTFKGKVLRPAGVKVHRGEE
jgi:molecular chaperone GrpE